MSSLHKFLILSCMVLGACCASWGCHHAAHVVNDSIPREGNRVSMPPYIIGPPDVLLIDAVRIVPMPPYHIEPLDALFIQVTGALKTAPIAGLYGVEPDGRLDLGASYGSVAVAQKTLEGAKTAIETLLKAKLNPPFEVSVSLGISRAKQQIKGQHLVRPDGTIGLGTYGSVLVDGLTLDEAKAAIEEHLSRFLQKPEIAVDVFSYNHHGYYVITDGGGYGQQVIRLPFTGKETVLDAISQINGLPAVSSKKHIWVARPLADDPRKDAILPVDWNGITFRGAMATNYQVFPGDRIYVKADTLITTDNVLSKLYAPVERTLGLLLLGNFTVRGLSGQNNGGSGGGF